LIIPIYYQNKLVSFQGRSLLNKKRCKKLGVLRYKTLNKEKSIIDPKHILYGLNYCKKDYIVITEGAPDVWRWGDNCAATLGTSVTDEQKNIILKYDRIIIIFDPEKEAQERALKLGNELNTIDSKKRIEIINTEAMYDLGDSSEKEINNLKKKVGI
jgi:DNA primase